MADKVYVALIISHKPIDMEQVRNAAGREARHIITQELSMGSSDGEYFVTGAPHPDEVDGSPLQITKGGDTLSLSVVGWLEELLASALYIPLYKRRKRAEKSQK